MDEGDPEATVSAGTIEDRAEIAPHTITINVPQTLPSPTVSGYRPVIFRLGFQSLAGVVAFVLIGAAAPIISDFGRRI